MSNPAPSEIDEVSLAAMLGRFAIMQRDLAHLDLLSRARGFAVPPGLAQSRSRIAANIEVICAELQQLRHDPAQLPLFPESHHATH